MRNLLTLLVLMSALAVHGQETVLHETVEPDTAKPVFGPNGKDYVHLYMSLGGFVDEATVGAEVNNARSSDFMYGIRYKHQFFDAWAIGGDFSYNRLAYRILQRPGKVFPTPRSHERERLTLQNISLGFFNRITYGKRGDRMGNYVDVGVYGDLLLNSTHYARDVNDVANRVGGKVTKVVNKNLVWLEPINYGTNVRIGMGRWALWAKYRLSDMMISGYGYPELSRVSVGVEVGLF